METCCIVDYYHSRDKTEHEEPNSRTVVHNLRHPRKVSENLHWSHQSIWSVQRSPHSRNCIFIWTANSVPKAKDKFKMIPYFGPKASIFHVVLPWPRGHTLLRTKLITRRPSLSTHTPALWEMFRDELLPNQPDGWSPTRLSRPEACTVYRCAKVEQSNECQKTHVNPFASFRLPIKNSVSAKDKNYQLWWWLHSAPWTTVFSTFSEILWNTSPTDQVHHIKPSLTRLRGCDF